MPEYSNCNAWKLPNRNQDTLNTFLINQVDKGLLPTYSNCCEYAPECGGVNPKPSPYYNRWGTHRFDTIPSAHINSDGETVPSNYIGPGTNEYEMIIDGYPPMSLSDTCAMLHDIMYSLSRDSDDNNNADATLLQNLDMVESLGEPVSNTLTARRIASLGTSIGFSAGSGGSSLADMKTHGEWNIRIPAYERVLLSLKTAGFSIGFLEEFFDKVIGRINLSTL